MHRPNSPGLATVAARNRHRLRPFRVHAVYLLGLFGLLFRYRSLQGATLGMPAPSMRSAERAASAQQIVPERALHRIASHRIASPALQSLSSAAQLVAPFVALRSAACCTMCCTLHAVAFARHVACRLPSRHTRHSLPLVNPVVRSAPCGELRAHASALSDGFPFHLLLGGIRVVGSQMTLGLPCALWSTSAATQLTAIAFTPLALPAL